MEKTLRGAARSFRRVARDRGLRTAAAAARDRFSELLRRRLLARQGAYYRLARRWHRVRGQFDVDEYDVPLDPLKIVWVDPDEVTRISPRRWPRPYDLGRVRGGDWDVRDEFVFGDDYERAAWKERDFGSMRFEETMWFRSFRDHYENGTPWEETVYVRAAVEALADGEMIHDWITTREELLEDLETTDELYRSIADRGYRPQVDLLPEGAPEVSDFRSLRLGELRLDVGRDGELLFAGGGKHRLAIAKVLDVERIPAVVVTRHERWMETLEAIGARRARRRAPDPEDALMSVADGEGDAATGRGRPRPEKPAQD